MRTRNYADEQARTVIARRPAGRARAIWITVGTILGLCCLVGLVGTVGYYFLSAGGAGVPLVLFHSPLNGERLEAGQPATIRAVASDEHKIVRVELWVDGQLQESETSSVRGGISSFPLLTDWQPPSAGVHTLTVRAFNSVGVRAHSTINVNVVADADRDSDGVADNEDACPDEFGSDFATGCPDRDRDGTPDAADACPDTAGIPGAGGCPSVAEGDRDGDGTPDETDACPDEPGSSLTEGCPDADGDSVADAEDACMGDPGSPEGDGCPTPGDSDSDGFPDEADACPEEWGPPESDGCPEGAVVPEGGAELEGGGRDSDGDGAADESDPCPEEAGSAEDGFCPRPEDDPEPADAGPLFEFPGFFLGEVFILNPVEFEALHFEVPNDYRRVWCYAQLNGGEMERYEFDPDGEREWDIAAVLGGANSAHLGVVGDGPLEVFAECYGVASLFVPRPYYLGSITRQHAPEEWDGHVIQADSSGGEPGGHSFRVRYHLCNPSCEQTALQPPVITRYTPDRDRIYLDWDWEGDIRTIAGFKLYVNGNFVQEIPREERRISWRQGGGVLCLDEWEFHLTAYGGPDAHEPDIESSPGNSIFWEGVPCEKHIRVTFETMNLHNPPQDEGGHRTPGPLYGSFDVTTGGTIHSLSFDAVECVPFPFPPFERCYGYKLNGGEHGVQWLFDSIHHSIDGCTPGLPCHARSFSASDTDTLTVQVNPGDDLTIGAHIVDVDEGPLNDNDVLFNGHITLDTGELSPDVTLTRSISGEFMDVVVKIDLFPFGP